MNSTPNPDPTDGFRKRNLSVNAADDAGEVAAEVWCETCQHVHIPDIPAVTWLCRDCGWGQWSEVDADAHVEAAPAHRPYRVGHWIPERIRKVAKERDEAQAEIERLQTLGGEVQNARGDAESRAAEALGEADRLRAEVERLREELFEAEQMCLDVNRQMQRQLAAVAALIAPDSKSTGALLSIRVVSVHDLRAALHTGAAGDPQ